MGYLMSFSGSSKYCQTLLSESLLDVAMRVRSLTLILTVRLSSDWPHGLDHHVLLLAAVLDLTAPTLA